MPPETNARLSMQANQWTTGAQNRAECHRPFSFALRAFVALTLLALAALFAPSSTAGELPALFDDAPVVGADLSKLGKPAAPPKGFKRARLAKLNPQLLAGGGSPLRQGAPVAGDAPNLSLNLFADKQLPVVITKTEFKGEGEFVAQGVIAGKENSVVLLAVNGDVMAGTVSAPGESMVKITYAGDGLHQVGEIAADELPPCGTQEVVPPNIGNGDVVPATAGDAVVVDVMVIYTTAAKTGAGGQAAIEAQIDLAIAEANACYSNSAVSLQLNLVYRGEVTYTESGSASTDLGRVQSGAGQLSSIPTLRDTYGADVVTLVTESMATYAGLGYVMAPVSSGFAPYAYNVIKREYFTGSYVFPHEVGHNMGCMHDRENASGQGAFDYSYGYRFDVSGTTYRTVMAYAPGTRIPYFSNPAVNYSGVATGVAAGATNSANNALTLSNSVPTVASFRSSNASFNFDDTAISANENDGTVTLTVVRTGSTTTNSTVAWATSAVSATAGSDYTTGSGTLTFATNETSKTITVTLLNDSAVETNETFKVTLSSPTGGPVLGVSKQATVTIVDDDIGIYLSSATNSVSEGGTNLVLTVTRSGGLTNTVTVQYATADGSATAGNDYTNTSGTLTFTNGVTSRTITIPIIDDSTIESNETFTVTLTSPGGGAALGTPAATTVTIVENDSSISFSTNAVSASESSTPSVTVTRTGGTAGTVTVDYLTVDGTATGGTDYTNLTSTLTFTNGQTSKVITMPLINDSSVEGDETFSLVLTNAAGGAVLGTYTNLTVTIRDNDSVFNFATNAITASEAAGNITLSVVRTGGVAGAATVHYSATNGTATVGNDFKALTGTLNFAAGETNKTITLQPINDTTVETNETLSVTLDTPTGEGSLGTNATVTVTLTDDDSLIGFASSTISVDEASTNLTLTVTRTGTLTLTNTIAYAFKAGSATAADFHGTNGVLTFAPGDTNKTITVAIVDDSVVETNETFQVILSSPTGGAAITGTNTATVTIVETDIGLSFAAAAYSVSEGATNVVLTVSRSGATNGTTSVDYATAGVSATSDADYTNTSGTLTFTNGVASRTITVPIIDDSTVETNETFKVVLSNVSGGIIVGSTNAVVTILENDASIVLATNAVSVSEVATNIALTVLRTGGTNTAMTVDYFTTDGTAGSSDYTAATGTLTFAAGEKSKTITIALTNDSSVEGDETFSLTLTNAASGAVLGSVTNTVVTIKDNDSVFSMSTNALTVAETAGTATLTVFRTGGLIGAATVNFASTNGTATAGSDYTSVTGTLSFAAGETNKTITVKITNDTTAETNETFTVGLSAPTGEGALSTNAVTTVTITDNDSTISFETNAVSVAESAGTVTLNVLRTGTLTLTNLVPYSFKAGTATTADFTGTNGVLTFLPGETNKTITAAIINDTEIETNETFTVVLGTPTGGALIGGTNTATVTITENDVAVAFLASTAAVWENATNVTLTVKRSGNTNSTVTVDYLTVDMTAVSDGDYTNTSGTLTFTNGVMSKTITIPIVEDGIVESDEKFKLVLTNASGGVISGTNTAYITIREDNSAFTLSSTNYSGREGTNVVITLNRIGNTNTTFVATLLTAYTGAATNTDFTAVNTNLTFATGQVSLTYSIPLTKDAVVDTNETFDVQIALHDAGFAAVSPTNATVTILDNTGSLQFAATTASVVESATNVLVAVTRTGGTGNALTVDYVTTDGSATNGLDYVGTTNTLSFAANETTKNISIALTNDSLIEGDENFTITLSNPVGAVLGTNTVNTVTIKDNDSVIAVATNAVTVSESVGKLSLAVTRTGGLAAAASVAYTTTNVSATAGSDYTALTGTLTFAAGETNKTISIAILNDTTYETNETFKLVLSAPTAEAVLSTNFATTVTITDNDSTLSWETNAVTIAEDGGSVTLTVNRTGATTLTNTITYAFKAGTATSADFTGTNGVLTFAPGDTNKTITVAIVNDSVVETNETFSVLLSNPTGGAVIGGTNSAYITIIDNDIGIAVASATRSVSEDATNIVLTVNRVGATNGTVTVDYVFTDVTATNNVDYHGTNGSLSFTNGVTSLTIDVPIVDDTEVESNETFKLSIGNPGGGAILSGLTNTTVTIVENDCSFAFTTNAVSVIETATNVTLTVKRTGGTNSTVTVDFLTVAGTASDGSDYTGTNATLTFAPGDLSKTINVSLSNDTSVEGDETFNVALTNLVGTQAVFGGYTNAVITIKDNDSVFSVLTNAVSVAENVGSATLSVRRTGGVVGVASVQFATAGGTATSGTDFTAVAGALNFKAGETNKTITIKITNDTAVESDETFTVTLSNATGEATVSTNNVTTVTILDNDVTFGDVAGSVAPISIVSLRWTKDGLPLLTIGGPIGAYIIVDASSDLENWTQITEQTIAVGTIEVTDSDSAEGNRFYRLRAPAANSPE